jgi:transposase
MLGSPEEIRAFVWDAPCDMRKQARGLMSMIEGQLQRDPRSGDMFVFLNRHRDMAKALFWDRTGICLLTKRLDNGKFLHRWTEEDERLTIEIDGYRMFELLSGK